MSKECCTVVHSLLQYFLRKFEKLIVKQVIESHCRGIVFLLSFSLIAYTLQNFLREGLTKEFQFQGGTFSNKNFEEKYCSM